MNSQHTYEAHAWLRIVSESLHPSEITEALQTQPNQMQVKGESRPVGNRKPYELNSWLLDSTVDQTSDIEDHIGELADFIARKAKELNRLVQSGRARVQMSCFVYYAGRNEHGALQSDPEVVEKLAMAPVKLGLEFYDRTKDPYRME